HEFVHHLADEFNKEKGLAINFGGEITLPKQVKFFTASSNYNHKIIKINWLEEEADVYDITVDEHHNFLLADGIFVHNSIDGDNPAAMRYTEVRMQ
ncbi:MAG: hypothetical protein LH472_01910, partial [Pyrinomonadaceae bacterium]|nr:hypothetical protein [Pyrinomonadaceae bacterium]